MTEEDLWCLGLSDKDREVVGGMIAEALHLKPNKKGLYQTDWGDKTALELFYAINSMLFQFSDKVSRETLARNRPNNVIPLKS